MKGAQAPSAATRTFQKARKKVESSRGKKAPKRYAPRPFAHSRRHCHSQRARAAGELASSFACRFSRRRLPFAGTQIQLTSSMEIQTQMWAKREGKNGRPPARSLVREAKLGRNPLLQVCIITFTRNCCPFLTDDQRTEAGGANRSLAAAPARVSCRVCVPP